MPRNKQGFTLIELLVVMSITTIIAGVSLANYRSAEKQKRTTIAADTILNALNLAQTYASSGKLTNNSNALCRVPAYYFVRLQYTNNTTISLRAVNNCAGTELIEDFPLASNTRIKNSGLVLNGTAATSDMTVSFKPPFGGPQAGIDGQADAAFSSVGITVESSDGSVSKTVTVDGLSGRIGN